MPTTLRASLRTIADEIERRNYTSAEEKARALADAPAMTDTATHDLALARAERDAWQTTCEELHHQIARLTVEAETYHRDIDAERACRRTLDAALAHEREAGRGLVAQVEALRAESRHHAAIAAQNATISNERDAASARAEAAERTLAGLFDDSKAEIAKLRAEVAELRAPVTVDQLRAATIPAPERAGDLVRLYESSCLAYGRGAEAMRAALAKLSPAPAREAAPTLVAVSDEELLKEFNRAHLKCPCSESDGPPPHCCDRAGIRAVRAKLGAAEVTEEHVKAALKLTDGITSSDDLTDGGKVLDDRATFFMAHLRASAAKGHDRG